MVQKAKSMAGWVHKRAKFQNLKGVERFFTRQIRGMRVLSYWDRLKELELSLLTAEEKRQVLEGQALPNPASFALQPYTTERSCCKCT